MPVHRYVVTVRTEKSGGGTFKPADEIGEVIQESIEAADPGSVSIDGVDYETTEFEVEEIDTKGQPVPWTEEAEARSKARAEKRKDERVKADAVARKRSIAYEAELKKRRAENPDGRVYIHTFDGDTELDVGEYDSIVFEVPSETEGWAPDEIRISRVKENRRRLEVKNYNVGQLLVRPKDSTCLQVEPTRSW